MSTTTETVSAQTLAPAGAEPGQSEQSKFVQHLATYPALTAIAGLVASFPVAKIFASNAVPLLHALHERSKPVADPILETATPYVQRLDSAGDKVLSYVDRRFPQLQQVQPADVYEQAQNRVRAVRSTAFDTYDSRVAKPLSNAARSARDQAESVYESRLGTYVAPINDRFESAIDQLLPASSEKDAVPSATEGRQLRRTYSLARIAAERAAPRLKELYEQKLDETSKHAENPNIIAKLLAVLATGRYISGESYAIVLAHFGTPEKLEAAVDVVKAKATEIRKQAAGEAQAQQ